MSRPPGVQAGIDSSGRPFMRVRRTSAVEDAVWDAVEAAVDAGWSPEKFKREAASCWQDKLREEARHVDRVLR